MIYLKLFLAFLEIGAVSFGGGYGMLSLMREKCLGFGWLTEESLMHFIAVSESTPGPIAINMATFIGSSQGGLLGSVCATFGVVLPSFVIILIIAAALRKLIEYRGVQAILSGIKPVVVGLILSTALIMLLSTLCGISTWNTPALIDWRGVLIFGLVFMGNWLYKRVRKRPFSPILSIVCAAVLGIALYGF